MDALIFLYAVQLIFSTAFRYIKAINKKEYLLLLLVPLSGIIFIIVKAYNVSEK